MNESTTSDNLMAIRTALSQVAELQNEQVVGWIRSYYSGEKDVLCLYGGNKNGLSVLLLFYSPVHIRMPHCLRNPVVFKLQHTEINGERKDAPLLKHPDVYTIAVECPGAAYSVSCKSLQLRIL